jgi:cysteine desulfurase
MSAEPVSPTPAEPLVVDSLGKHCPVPVIDLAQALPNVDVGAEILVLADDPGAKIDIPVWCRMKGQQLLGVDASERGWAFRVRRTS